MSTPTGLKTPSGSQKVLSLPELVLLTIKDLTPRDMHSTALVCRMWSEIALDGLWETAVSLAPLLNTLATMRYSVEESSWTFVTDLSQANWIRFHTYARRIRTVEIRDPQERWSRPVSEHAMETVQASMPPGYHFPRPVVLMYYGLSQDSNSGTLSLRNFLYVVSTSARKFDFFEVGLIDRDCDDAPVQDLFRRFGELVGPSLESVSLSHASYFSNSPAIPHLIKRHASTISTLDLCVFYTEGLWAAIRGLHNLKEFVIDLGLACESRINRTDTIMALDNITSGIFPRLEVFSVHLPADDIAMEQRRLDVFSCISRLTQLTSLKITSTTSISPYADQMRHIGHSLCRLETLRIDTWVWGGAVGISSSLASILRSFPHIKRLEARVICDAIPDTAQTKVHSSLEVLDLSRSAAPRARKEEVASFLKSILPRTARIVHTGGNSVFRLGAGEAAWNEIARLMDET